MEKITEEELRKVTGANSYFSKGMPPAEREMFSTRALVITVARLGGFPVRKDRLSYWIPPEASRNEERLLIEYQRVYNELLRNRQSSH